MIALALALALQGQEIVGPPPPHILYRWKNSQGQVHVTTTAPPPGAIIIETMHHGKGEADNVVVVIPEPTPEECRISLESVLKPETVAYWHRIDESFSKARQSGDTKGQLAALDDVLATALMGSGLWAMPLIPALLVAICALLAWWFSAGRSKRVRVAVWSGSAVLCLVLSHVCIQVAIHRPQARRLDLALSMLPNYLGDYATLAPEDCLAVADSVVALSNASATTSATWKFPAEIHRTRRTLVGLLQKLDSQAQSAEALPASETTGTADAE